MIYDIFISYRREGGFDTAKHLNDLLVRDGYTVSFDIDTLREGNFDEALLANILSCTDFLVVIDKHAFDRMKAQDYDREKDWMRKEIEFALTLKKNIIPILLADASFPKKLPKELKDLELKNGPKYSKDYFDTFYEKLKRFLHSKPYNSNIIAQRENLTYGLANLKIKVDLDCRLFIDGEEQRILEAGKIYKFPLAEGEYELWFVSVENECDRVVLAFEMPPKDTLKQIHLAEKREKRLEEESAERREQEKIAREKAEKEAKLRVFLKDQVISVEGVSFVMKPVEGGDFYMGAQKTDTIGHNFDEDAYENECPVHCVTVGSFYIGETEVTQTLWKAVMGDVPSWFRGGDMPVVRVNWFEIQEFIRKLNQLTGKQFRLPTEEEWEYAARGGKHSNGYKYAGSNNIDEVAWYIGNSGNKTHPVKTKLPNELGVYDMSGNVWEWCDDWYFGYGSNSQIDLEDQTKRLFKVLRGGGWGIDVRNCRVSVRGVAYPEVRHNYYGFRLVLPQ